MSSARALWTQTFLPYVEKGVLSEAIYAEWWAKVEDRYNEPQRAYHTLQHLDELAAHLNDAIAATATTATATHPNPNPPQVQNHKVLVAALIFHDIIYDPTAPDNEDKSAVVFQDFVDELRSSDTSRLGIGSAPNNDNVRSGGDGDEDNQKMAMVVVPIFTAEEEKEVVNIILATKHHTKINPAEVSSDCSLFLDMDLAILGVADMERYKQYAVQIGVEYGHYPPLDYCMRRAAVLQTFRDALLLPPPATPVAGGKLLVGSVPLFKTPYFMEKLKGYATRNLAWEINDLKARAEVLRKKDTHEDEAQK